MHTVVAPPVPLADAETRSLPILERPGEPSPTVVIADPNPCVRRELGRSIRALLGGEPPREARSPSEVLTWIADARCKVLVIDPCMPTVGQHDGMPLLRRICSLRNDLLVLVISHQPRQLLRDRALPSRIKHVYAKTVDPAWLCHFIRPVLQPCTESQHAAPLEEALA